MSCSVLRTDKAEEQIRDILFYIAEDSGSVEIALNYLDKLEKAVTNLALFPYTGVKPRYSTLRKQGYLVLVVERYLIFYKVNDEEKTVTVYAVVDGRREYQKLI